MEKCLKVKICEFQSGEISNEVKKKIVIMSTLFNIDDAKINDKNEQVSDVNY
jgi:hypothetical protein